MKTKPTITRATIRTLWTSLLIVFLGTLLAGQAHGQIYVTINNGAAIGEYDATTGATINAALVSGFYHPLGITVSGGNLFVAFDQLGTVGEFNATTGATVNASFITMNGDGAAFIAVSGGNLFVTNDVAGTIGEYNATTGATVNAALVSGLNSPVGVAVSGGNLYVANTGSGTIGEYNATTGATVNAALVSGLTAPYGIAVSGGNLYVVDAGRGTIGEYNATTGATVNAALVSGVYGLGIAVVAPYSAQIQQPINPDGSSVFNAKRGVVPVKFTLTLSGVATCQLPSATISLFRTAGTAPGPIDESTYLLASDNGSNFRISDCQYVYNLATGSLGAGTYTVNILIDGNIVGNGTFSLK